MAAAAAAARAEQRAAVQQALGTAALISGCAGASKGGGRQAAGEAHSEQGRLFRSRGRRRDARATPQTSSCRHGRRGRTGESGAKFSSALDSEPLAGCRCAAECQAGLRSTLRMLQARPGSFWQMAAPLHLELPKCRTALVFCLASPDVLVHFLHCQQCKRGRQRCSRGQSPPPQLATQPATRPPDAPDRRSAAPCSAGCGAGSAQEAPACTTTTGALQALSGRRLRR